ncbi:MAG: hypothetical protein JWL96_2309 [Sphingomonas bacterium]|uniref:DUF5681 domain-containing protein n=1 Tax=Sphingomonas bacterium TaxID=1895847 RepID=UPI00261BC5CA|nr:DUF5681 domain-containing protein [Sphingomonas bacterium]MDB5710239.1 hypothetical protein [Sphingomonas bacterium]
MDVHNIESGRDRDTEESTAGAPVAIGRGKPPPAHRWSKGQSGNPAGRPPRPRPRQGSRGDRLLGADEPTRMMILEEAYQLVTIKENGVEYEMPLSQAIWRAMGRAALSGNRQAQYRYTRIVREMEREQLAAQAALYHALEREHYRRLPGASFADDLVYDVTSGAVVVRGDTA